MCGLETGSPRGEGRRWAPGTRLAAEVGSRLGMRGQCGGKRELLLTEPALNPGSAPLLLGGLLWASVSLPGKQARGSGCAISKVPSTPVTLRSYVFLGIVSSHTGMVAESFALKVKAMFCQATGASQSSPQAPEPGAHNSCHKHAVPASGWE